MEFIYFTNQKGSMRIKGTKKSEKCSDGHPDFIWYTVINCMGNGYE